MRSINADICIEKIKNLSIEYDAETVQRCIEVLSNAPTIDAEPVRHGKNIGTDYDEVDQFVCSECGIELQDWRRVERDDYDGEETFHEYRLRYCPNCGTKMEKI